MFACLFIPDFPAEAILRFEPELRKRAVAVLAGRPPLERVVGMNENARHLGVEIKALKAQVEAWEELVLRARSESQESSAHAALLDCAQSFSPEVEETAVDAVLLNLAGLEPLFGPPAKIIDQIAARAWQMGLKINVAAAANPDAAFLAARGFPGVTLIAEGREAQRLGELPVDTLFESFSADVEQASRWLETFDRWGVRNLRALAALPEVPVSERLGQEGVRLQKLARGATSRKLRLFEPQPVFEESVELEYPIVLLEPLAFLLNRMLEQVCARLEARALAAQELRLMLELAHDLDAETQGLKPLSSEGDDARLKARSSTSRSPTFDLRSSSEIDDAALSKNCFGEETREAKLQDTRPGGASQFSPAPGPPASPVLACWGGGLQRWEDWKLQEKSRRDGPIPMHTLNSRSSTFTRTLRLPLPMLNAKVFLKLLQLDLQAHPPGAPIVKIHLLAEPARPRTAQTGLFQPVFPEPEKLELTLARIAGIVGEERVGSAELLDTHQEGAFEMRHFAPVEPEAKPSGKQRRNSDRTIHPLSAAKAGLDSAAVTARLEAAPLQNAGEIEDPVLRSWDGDAQEKMSAVIALRLFRPPLRAVVNLREGKPVRLKCIHREDIFGDIVWHAGPWRSSGDWSEQEGWSREEWDIAVPNESGLALYRLVEDRLSRNWFVEGMYD
jgi:hypothetical protein